MRERERFLSHIHLGAGEAGHELIHIRAVVIVTNVLYIARTRPPVGLGFRLQGLGFRADVSRD